MSLRLHVAALLACLLLLPTGTIAPEPEARPEPRPEPEPTPDLRPRPEPIPEIAGDKPTECLPDREHQYCKVPGFGFGVDKAETHNIPSADQCRLYCVAQKSRPGGGGTDGIHFYSWAQSSGLCKCVSTCSKYNVATDGAWFVNGILDCNSPKTCKPSADNRRCLGGVVRIDGPDEPKLGHLPIGNYTKCRLRCRHYVNVEQCDGCEYFSYDNNNRICQCLSSCYGYGPVTDLDYYNGLIMCESGIEGEPHFVGAKGTHYDFNGALDKSFCLFTDKNLHINGLFEGFTRNRRLRTWIKDLHISWKDQFNVPRELLLAGRRGVGERRGDNGFIARLTVDGNNVPVPHQVGEKVIAAGGLTFMLQDSGTIVKRSVKHKKAFTLDRDTFSLDIDGLASFEISVNPDYEAMRAPDDAQVHFNLVIKNVKTTPQVHGVLGQTFQPGLERTIRATEYQILTKLYGRNIAADGNDGAGFLDGSTFDYVTSAIDQADCKFATAWNNA